MAKRFKGLFRFTAFRIGVLLSILFALLYLVNPSVAHLFELKAYDLRLQWRGEIPTAGKLVIVAVDDKSLRELGQWPWSRIVMAQLIRRLSRSGARVIGLDLFWPEPERAQGVLDALYSGEAVEGIPFLGEIKKRVDTMAEENPELDSFLRKISRSVHPDEILARAIRESGRVVLGDFFIMPPRDLSHGASPMTERELPLMDASGYPVVQKRLAHSRPAGLPRPLHVKGNIPVIARSARAFGYTNAFPDEDGVVRSVPIVAEYRGRYLLPLSLQTLRYAGDPSRWVLDLDAYGVAGIRWEDRRIPCDQAGNLYINFRGKDGSFPRIPAVDVINGRAGSGQIKGKIVLVGAVAEGTHDLLATPLASVLTGVEVHANIIDNLLAGDFISKPRWASLMDISILLSLGLGLGLLFPRLRPTGGALCMLLLLGVHLYTNTWALLQRGVWLNMIYPCLLVPSLYLCISVHRHVQEEREKQEIKRAFQHYVSPSVVNQMIQNPNLLKLGGQQRELTVLFSDIRGFTGLSENLDPARLVRLLNEYFTEMTDAVFMHAGTLDKYMGDAVMAFYGAPLPLEEHASMAALTALEMRTRLGKIRARWEPNGLGALEVGIGINTGEMVVGNMGSHRHFNYTVIGDHVNLASRLEALNKQYGTSIIISEFTWAIIRESFACRELDRVRVKGRARTVTIYELLGREGEGHELHGWIDMFLAGLEQYRNRKWDAAEDSFASVLEIRGDDPPSRLYLERCRMLRTAEPPEGWNGVFEWDLK